MMVYTFKDGKYTISFMGKQGQAGTYKLEAKKGAVYFDRVATEGEGKGQVTVGLLKLEGDVMTITFAVPDNKDRPKNFDDGKDIVSHIMKRGK